MADLVSGALLGVAFGELYNLVKNKIIEFKQFKTNLENIKFRLDSLEPLINTIGDQSAKLNLPKEIIENLKEKMEGGKELVSKCSEVGEWSSYRKLEYANQLEELDRSLDRQIELLKLQGVSSAMEALVLLTNKDMPPFKAAASSLPVGFDVPLKELKKKILEDGVSRLVLTGPQGFGKTTLAKAFCQDEEVKGTFKDNVIFVLVSKKPDLAHIVQQLYRHKDSQLPNNIDLKGNAVYWLQKFLKDAGKDPLLLVLDDVWSGCESLLDNLNGPGMPDYKILVTSVFGFPSFGYQYYLKSLEHKDAMTLFLHSASLKDKSSCILEDLVEKIVQRCKGFPLAITFMGRALCGKPIQIWLNRVRVWEEDSFILGAGTDFLAFFQSSLVALVQNNTNIKEYFMDLSSFTENQRIPVPALIDMWEELYDCDEETILNNLREMITNHSLANHTFIRKEKMEGDDFYSEHFLTQHYMLRQLAFYHMRRDPKERREKLIIEICGNNFPKWLIEQKYQPIKARLLSISTDQMFSQDLPDMQAPEVKVLVLNFQTQNYSLPKFVKKMDTLKALIVRNHGFLYAELRRFQLLALLPNLKRIRLEGILMPSITNSYHEEKYLLQKISLFMCKKLGDTFIRCPNFPISKALPNLVELNIDYCNDLKILPDELCGLIHLKKLSITSCGKLSILPVGIGKLVNLQLLRLRSCTYLIKLPDSIKNLTSLDFLDISYCFSIKQLPEQFGEMQNLKKLDMRHCSGLEQLPQSVLLLQQLNDVICDEETENLWTSFLGDLNIKLVKEDM